MPEEQDSCFIVANGKLARTNTDNDGADRALRR
jgi:hypothetical protein